MKAFLLTSLLFAVGTGVQADDYQYLTFQKTDGTEQSLSVSSLQLVVSDGTLVATNTAGTVNFTLTELSSMYFSATATGVGSTATIAAAGTYEIYNTAGTLLYKGSAMPSLPAGVYVVKQNGQTSKLFVK